MLFSQGVTHCQNKNKSKNNCPQTEPQTLVTYKNPFEDGERTELKGKLKFEHACGKKRKEVVYSLLKGPLRDIEWSGEETASSNERG